MAAHDGGRPRQVLLYSILFFNSMQYVEVLIYRPFDVNCMLFQFDTTATAVIMTKASTKVYYTSYVNFKETLKQLEAIQVLRNAFFLEIRHPPPNHS